MSENQSPTTVGHRTRIRIVPSKGWVRIGFHELWAYRELMYFLAVREIKVRYKQTAVGVAWAVIQPLFTMLVFSLFFGRLGKMPSEGIPYPLFSLAALIPWSFFAAGLGQSSNSLVGNSNLITKVYFPRLIIPISSVLSGLLDFALGLALLLIFMAAMGFFPNLHLLWSIPFLLLALVTSLGTGLWFSALNVEYRDVRYIVPFLTQFWMFATPIAYSGQMLREPWRSVYGINPMVGVTEGFRWAVLGRGNPPGSIIFISSLAALLVLISGLYYFRRMERTFADIV
ncbi:MAG TPA: ABC transporter permease [Bryobacteraceae bacterium]|jgi:lipopolysaccharide transport system permease protein